MVDSIKITALQDIGANIAYTTLVPVVNMAGTPTTQKSNLQNLGNLILNGAGGSYFPRAAQATLALSVANAAQPNITSVGTLTTLTVSGNITAANIQGGNLVSANYFSGDGGFLTNIAVATSYSNSNVANYLPNYTGVIGANTISSVPASGSNVRINANGAVFMFGQGGALEWPAPGGALWAIEPNVDDEFEIKSTSNVVISTDVANANSHFTFDSNGIFTAPSNVNLLGSRLNVGPDAATAANLLNPTLVIANTGAQFIQSAIINNDGAGSSDWIAYGAGGSDQEAWADLGYAGFSFNDANYTITAPGDGYVFAQAYANGIGGNLVIATGDHGNSADIVFATGGFLSSNEFARFSHANNALELTRADTNLKFAASGSISNPANSSLDPLTPNVSTMVLTPDQNYSFQSLVLDPTSPGHIHLRSPSYSSNIDEPGANIFLGGELSSFEVGASYGVAPNVFIHSGGNTWTFNTSGGVLFPTLTVDLHNGGNQTAQTLQFSDPTQQVIITGPTPDVDNNAQRLIIQGQRGNGTGEGGDVYVWAGDADTNGGDIKIYAGDADGAGYGGYINLDGGSGQLGGGQLTLTGGYSSNGAGGQISISAGYSGNATGAVVSINGGQSALDGGAVQITGGYGTGNAGGVVINGGQSALGLPGYGNVTISAGASSWVFDNAGNLTLPGNLVSAVASPAPSITGFTSINTLFSVTTPVAYSTLIAVAGGRAFINDANLVAAGNFGAQVGSGGSNTVPVWSDGINWYIG